VTYLRWGVNLSFNIKIKGLKELERKLGEMIKGLTLPSVDCWCKKIEAEARRICPQEHEETIMLKAAPAGSGKFNIQLKASKEAVPCVKEAIETNLNLMPSTTRAIFEALLKEIDKN